MSADSANPKLRADLLVSQTDSAEYELEDGATGAKLTLDSTGYLIAEQFESGGLSVKEVRETLDRDYGLKVTQDKLLAFLHKADELGFLDVPLSKLGFAAAPEAQDSRTFSVSAEIRGEEEVRRLQKEISSFWKYLRSANPKLLLGLALAFVCLILPWPFKLQGNLVMQPARKAVVRAPVSGIVEEVFVEEGRTLNEGDPLLRFESFRGQIARKESEIAGVAAELARLRRGATKEEGDQILKKVDLARKLSSQASERAERHRALHEKGILPLEELQKTIAEEEIRAKELEGAQAELRLIESGTRPELIRAKEAEKAALEVDLELLLELEERRVVTAPIDGVVATPDIAAIARRHIQAGDFIMDIVDLSRLTAELKISERDIDFVARNQEVHFKVQAAPQKTFVARVSRISPVGEASENVFDKFRTFRIEADLDNPGPLAPGMTGVGQIRYGRMRSVGWIFFRNAIRHMRVSYVF